MKKNNSLFLLTLLSFLSVFSLYFILCIVEMGNIFLGANSIGEFVFSLFAIGCWTSLCVAIGIGCGSC